MGKIVKYCSSCDENFAAKFGFCPNCGAALQAFEMNPVSESKAEEAPAVVAAPVEVTAPIAVEPPAPDFIEPEPVIEVAPAEEMIEETEPEIETVIAPPVTVPVAPVVYASATTLDADRVPVSLEEEHSRYARDGGFYVTVIEEKNVGQRNSLLAGALGFMILALTTGLVYNIFTKDVEISAINDDIFSAILTDLEPMTVEEEQQKKDKDDGGGGGGGGREEKDPVSQGDLADQSKTPTRPPNVNTMKSDTPMLETPTTEGTMKFPKIYGKWGDPNAAPGLLSNGPGTGGGAGNGRGQGQGEGNGGGAGNGNGSGWGNGNGNGNGNGTGDGDGEMPPPVPVPFDKPGAPFGSPHLP